MRVVSYGGLAIYRTAPPIHKVFATQLGQPVYLSIYRTEQVAFWQTKILQNLPLDGIEEFRNRILAAAKDELSLVGDELGEDVVLWRKMGGVLREGEWSASEKVDHWFNVGWYCGRELLLHFLNLLEEGI